MPDFDHDRVAGPLRALGDLAADGRARARHLPVDQVRALGAQRHRRRITATVAAASVAVVVFVGGALAATAQLTSTAPPGPASPGGATIPPSLPTTAPSEPGATTTKPDRAPTSRTVHVESPSDSETATRRASKGPPAHRQPLRSPRDTERQAGSGPGQNRRHAAWPPRAASILPRSVLLQASQTWYHQGGDFDVSRTVHGGADDPVWVCQQGSLATLGAVDRRRRDFVIRGGGDPVLRSAALQFTNASTARAAYDTLGAWASQCEATVRSLGYDTVADNGQWYPVETADGLAQFRSGMSYGPVDGDTTGQMAYYDDEGIVLTGRRVMLISLVVPATGQDYNWAYSEQGSEQTGLPLHPMFHMLPTAAHTLAG